MIKLLTATKRNGNIEPKTATDELVKRFLKLAGPEDYNTRQEPFNGTKVKIESNDGNLRIAYEFTETEVAILRTLSEVSGVSINWLAKDAAHWLRSYIGDLAMCDTGQLYDLLGGRNKFGCNGAAYHKIPPTHRKKTRNFIDAFKRAGRDARLEEKAVEKPLAHHDPKVRLRFSLR